MVMRSNPGPFRYFYFKQPVIFLYFLDNYVTLFYVHIFSDARVSPTSYICSSAMLVLSIVVN